MGILVALTVSLPSHRVKKVPTSHALECPTAESSANKGLNQVEMSVDEPLPSNLRESASSTSGHALPCGTEQSAKSKDYEAANLTKTPSSKISWRQLEQTNQTQNTSILPPL